MLLSADLQYKERVVLHAIANPDSGGAALVFSAKEGEALMCAMHAAVNECCKSKYPNRTLDGLSSTTTIIVV